MIIELCRVVTEENGVMKKCKNVRSDNGKLPSDPSSGVEGSVPVAELETHRIVWANGAYGLLGGDMLVGLYVDRAQVDID